MIRTAFAFILFALPAQAITLELPAGAVRTAERLAPFGRYRVPVAPWAEAGLPAEVVEGRILREAWQVPSSATTLQLLAPLRDQLDAQGFERLFECETEDCGGFDFRFEAEVLPEPAMHVDLGDFQFLSARRGEGAEAEFLTLMVSRSSTTGFLQIVTVQPRDATGDGLDGGLVTSAPPAEVSGAGNNQPSGPAAAAGPPPLAGLEGGSDAQAPPTTGLAAGSGAMDTADIARALETVGRAVLPGLTFETGSSQLAAQDGIASLEALAAYLKANPARRVVLVGHTDASGSLAANVALSRARARSVLEALVADYGVPRAQLEADGVGYLMPRAANLTDEGRAANRRVEAVLISLD